MKREQSSAPVPCRPCTIILTALMVFACFASVRAQRTPEGIVIPTVCVTPNSRTGTTTIKNNAPAGGFSIDINNSADNISRHARIVINPGGATEETFLFASRSDSQSFSLRTIGGGTLTLAFAHSAGETVQWYSDATATFGYNNTSSNQVIIPRGVTSGNYFSPGPTVYSQQPNTFAPGIHNNALSMDMPTRDGLALSWNLDGGQATASKYTPACATITYQGRLSDTGAAANGQYDLRFTAFDALTGGTAQSESVTVENASVVNGVFTVQLNFFSSFANNPNARFLEIGVRPGAATGSDPFTILTPRQPITKVPYAVHADTAVSAINAAHFNGLAPDKYLTSINGNTTIPGDTQINGDGGIGNNLIVTNNGGIGGNLTVGGYVKLSLTTGIPPAADCDETSEHGRMKVDATNNKLYICTASGWKSSVL